MKKTPNVLLITSDQQHWNAIGYRNPEVRTPNLDRLAREGTTFSRAYCPNPTCTPSRSSIITGLYPSQHGAWSLGTKLREDVQTIGDILSEHGYRTALVGKAHFQPLQGTPEFPSIESYPLLQDLDYWRHFTGPFYGFDHVELARNHTNEAHVGQHYAVWMEEQGLHNWRDFFVSPTGTMDKSERHAWPIPEAYHHDAWIADQSAHLMEEYAQSGEPFFLWSSFFDPHPPYLVPKPWDTLYSPEKVTVPSATPGEHDQNPPHYRMTQEESPDFTAYNESGMGMHGMHSHLHNAEDLSRDIAMYYGMISLMDKYIGKILDTLDALGLAENTIVVFASDHGHFYGHHGLTAKGPFHYEDLIRVPMCARYPGHIVPGVDVNALQSLVDFTPTMLGLLGLDIPRHMTGLDQSEVWLGRQSSVRDHILCENHHEPTTIHLKTYVGERYKITVYYNQTFGELFDLKQDPGETNNLWDNPDFSEIKLNLLLKTISAELGKEPMWMPRIAIA